MELKQAIALFRRWTWLLILGLVIGAIVGGAVSLIEKPVYEATTKVLITRAPEQSSAPDNILTDQQLTQTFTQLLTIRPVFDAASEQLGFEVDPDKVEVAVIVNTQIVQVTVQDHDPDRAILIADTLVTIALQQYLDIQTGQYVGAEENIQAQIGHVEEQINSLLVQIDQASATDLQAQIEQVQAQMTPLQDEVTALQQEIAQLSPAVTQTQKSKVAEDEARIAEITPLLSLYQQIYSNLVVMGEPMSLGGNTGTDQLTILESTLELYQQIYTSLLSDLESIRLAKLVNTSNAVQIEPAVVAEKAVRPRPVLYIFLAAFCGLLLTGCGVLLAEYLDDTIKTPEDVRQLLNLPVLGYVAEMKKNGRGEKILIDIKTHSPMREAFRSLKTNLEFMGLGKQMKTVLVTSSEQEDGKTTVAANLAVALAQEGKRVLLVDADMHNPSLHDYFDIPAEKGLGDMLEGDLDLGAASHSWKKLKTLKIVPSGKVSPDSIWLLGSEKMGKILGGLKKSFDMILIDTPPAFIADAQALTDKADAVVLVVQPRHTHRDSALAALEQFNRTGTQVVGVVLNRVQRDGNRHYYNYHSYSRRKKGSKTIVNLPIKPEEPAAEPKE